MAELGVDPVITVEVHKLVGESADQRRVRDALHGPPADGYVAYGADIAGGEGVRLSVPEIQRHGQEKITVQFVGDSFDLRAVGGDRRADKRPVGDDGSRLGPDGLQGAEALRQGGGAGFHVHGVARLLGNDLIALVGQPHFGADRSDQRLVAVEGGFQRRCGFLPGHVPEEGDGIRMLSRHQPVEQTGALFLPGINAVSGLLQRCLVKKRRHGERGDLGPGAVPQGDGAACRGAFQRLGGLLGGHAGAIHPGDGGPGQKALLVTVCIQSGHGA